MDAQADLSLRWAHTHFVGFIMSRLILWQVIAGCLIAFQLAKQGINIVLISRTESKLKDVASEIGMAKLIYLILYAFRLFEPRFKSPYDLFVAEK